MNHSDGRSVLSIHLVAAERSEVRWVFAGQNCDFKRPVTGFCSPLRRFHPPAIAKAN